MKQRPSCAAKRREEVRAASSSAAAAESRAPPAPLPLPLPPSPPAAAPAAAVSCLAHATLAPAAAGDSAPARSEPCSPFLSLLQRYPAARPSPQPARPQPAPSVPATPRSAALRARLLADEELDSAASYMSHRTPRSAQLRRLRLTPDEAELQQRSEAAEMQAKADTERATAAAREPALAARPSRQEEQPQLQLARSLLCDMLQADDGQQPQQGLQASTPLSAPTASAAALAALAPLTPLSACEAAAAAQQEAEEAQQQAERSFSSTPPAPPATVFDDSEHIPGLSTPAVAAAAAAVSALPSPLLSPTLRPLFSTAAHGSAVRVLPSPSPSSVTAPPSPSAVVVLQAMRADPSVRQSLGSALFVSPVRRSQRHLSGAEVEAAAASSQQLTGVLQPNTALVQQRADLSSSRRDGPRDRQEQPQPQPPAAAVVAVASPVLAAGSVRRQGTPKPPSQSRRSSCSLLPPPPLQHPNVIVLQPVRGSASASHPSSSASAAAVTAPLSPSLPSAFVSPVRRSARHQSDWQAADESVRRALSRGQVALLANEALGEREAEWKQRRAESAADSSPQQRLTQLMPPPQPRLPSKRRRAAVAEHEAMAAAPVRMLEGGRRHCTPRPGTRRSRSSASEQ